ncbi:MAG: PAS domain S-box protein [Marinilabiliaceae bacterium]|nr:PAS domain S-box protein [Marinilabiliaceae bacterium]
MDNYLKTELYRLFKEDESIFTFLQDSTLDGLWYWDLENPENEWMNERFWTTLGYNPAQQPHKASTWQNIINPDDLKVAIDNFNKHLQDPHHPYDQVVRYTHKNGSTVWIQCRGMAIRNEAGKPIRMLGAHVNVTRQKDAEISLREQEEKYRLIVQSTSDVIWIYNVSQQRFSFISSSVYNLRGYTAEEAMQMSFDQTLTPDSAQKVRQLIASHIQEFEITRDSNKHYMYQFQQPCKNGDVIWIEASATYRYNTKGEIEAVGISRNIEERKRVEQALKDSEAQYRTLFEKSKEPIAIMKKNRFIDCNQALLDVLKIGSKRKLLKLSPWHLSPKYQSDGIPSRRKAKEFINCAQEKGYCEFEWLHTDAEKHPIWFLISLSKMVIKEEELLYVIYRNITPLKNAESSLKDQQQHLKTIFNSAQVGIALIKHRKTIFANQYICTLTGYHYDEFIGIDTSFIYPTKEEYELAGKTYKTLKGTNYVSFETRCKIKDGSIINVIVNAAFYNGKNEEDGIITVITDISKQKEAEQKLLLAKEKIEESEKRFKKLFFSSNTAVFLLNEAGIITDCNQAAIDLFKYQTKTDLLHRKPWVLSPEYQPSGYRSDDITVIDGIIQKALQHAHSIHWMHQDASEQNFPTEISFSPIQMEDETFIYMYIRDTSFETALKKSAAELKKANEDKNRFFSVLAHDLRGSLGNNVSIVDLLQEGAIDEEHRDQLIQCLIKNTTKAYELLTKLITWGKATMNKEAFVPVNIKLLTLLNSIYEYSETILSQKDIQLIINCPKEVCLIADQNMMETIFRNLISNAIKFSQKGGTIHCHCTIEKEDLEVGVSDSGTGMPLEKAANLFTLDNLESVKGTAGEQGSGLGLQIVKEYVKIHGGTIWAESELGKGTTISFRLPIKTCN